MKNAYEVIAEYLAYLKHTCGYDVVVFDPFGAMRADSGMEPVLREYINHNNPVCMNVKSDLRLWRRCVLLKRALVKRIERDGEPFWGECYCGVAEYIYPCFARGQLVGAVCVAGYRGERFSPHMAELIGARTGISALEFMNLRETALQALPQDFEVMATQLGVLAKLIERLVWQKLGEGRRSEPGRATYALDNIQNSREQQMLVMQALEYIRQMYAQPVKVKDVADFCHVSEPYLQHLVKNSQGSGIYEILLRHRMDRARILLREQSVSEVSARCGYTDPNYFITAFKKRFGVTPGQYRRYGIEGCSTR